MSMDFGYPVNLIKETFNYLLYPLFSLAQHSGHDLNAGVGRSYHDQKIDHIVEYSGQ